MEEKREIRYHGYEVVEYVNGTCHVYCAPLVGCEVETNTLCEALDWIDEVMSKIKKSCKK